MVVDRLENTSHPPAEMLEAQAVDPLAGAAQVPHLIVVVDTEEVDMMAAGTLEEEAASMAVGMEEGGIMTLAEVPVGILRLTAVGPKSGDSS